MNIGIENTQKINQDLSALLADSYTLFLKLQNFHWNVKGKFFRGLHIMFEEQYNELFNAIDEIAERITSLGYDAPGTFAKFSNLRSLKDNEGVPKAEEMVKELISDHESIVRKARSAIENAEASKDYATVDLLTKRIESHEKTAWMLRSLLEENK
jgi:starvation-inducible DNA-binding protein